MPSVDDRIVRIDFDNASFERKIDTTLKSLAQLDQALRLEGAGKGLAAIGAAADSSGGHLASIAQGVDHIASRFSAMGAVAFSVISNITTSALGMAKKVGGDILEPIITGGKRRALNIEQAKFMFQGLGVDVEKAMASSKKAVLSTAYGLDEAAKAAAQFAASGIDAGDEMTHTLEGVAGIAAMTNSSFSEIADVFTAAAGQGKISGYTLERISYRGLNAAAAFAKQTGKTEAEVRKMASEGKISFKEFASAMDKAFGAHAQEANKTYTGSLANMHAAMSRLGAQVWTPQLEQQRDLFNTMTPTIDKLAKALTPLIDIFTVMSRLSMDRLIKSINSLDFKNVEKAGKILQPAIFHIYQLLQQVRGIAGKAFRDIFPKSTISVLVQMAKAFAGFVEKLRIGGQLASNIRSIFRGFFAILSIGWTVIKEGVKFLAQIVSALLGLSGGSIVSGLARIGDFFTNLQKSLVQGKGIHDFFAALLDIFKATLPFIEKVKDAIAGLFGGFDKAQAKTVETLTGRVEDRFASLHRLMDRLSGIWQPLQTAFDRIKDVLTAIWDYISNFFKTLGKNIADVMGGGSFNDVLDAINTGLFAGITALFYKFIKGGLSVDLTGGLMDRVGGMFDQLTDNLKAMQTQIKADALMKIAIAIGILTASVLTLSLIDSAALTKSLTAMAVGFGQLLGAFAIIDQISSGPKGAIQFDLIAGGMIALASALLILSGAVAALGSLDWGQLARGLTGITGILAILSVALIPLSRQKGGMIAIGVGLTAIGVGLNILAAAVVIFGKMKWGDMAKGLLGVAAALLIVGVAAKTMPANMPITGAGLILVAVGLNILAGAIALFGTMDWGTIGKGLVAVAGALVVIAAAMQLMPVTLPITGAGLILVGIGLNAVAGALKSMGSMNWGQIGKGLAAMAGALLILAVATNAMSGAIGGAVAIAVVSVSLGILAKVLKSMSDLSWGDLLHGLVAIAAALAVLAVAALLMEPAIPAMLGMGAALTLIGASFALVGTGVYLLAKGFETLAKSGAAGAKAIVEALKTIGRALPSLMSSLALGLLDFVNEFAKGLPMLVATIGEFLSLLLTELTKLLPKIGEFVTELLTTLFEVVRNKAPDLVETGLFVLITFLSGIRDNITEIVSVVAEIITAFFDAMGQKVPEIITSLTNMVIKILTSLAENLGRMSATLWIGLGIAFVRGFIQGLQAQLPQLKAWFGGLPLKILQWIGNALMWLYGKGRDFIQGIINGAQSMISRLSSWFGALPGKVIGFIGNVLGTLASKGRDLLQGLWNGAKEVWNQITRWAGNIIQGIKDKIPNPLTALWSIGSDIITGLLNGIKSAWKTLTGWIGDAASHLPGFIKKPLGLGSPSRVFAQLGRWTAEGFFNGIRETWDENADQVFTSTPLLDNINKVISDVSAAVSQMDEFNPVITPVLDLTQVAADASLISDYIQQSPTLPASFSLAQANTIAATPTPPTPGDTSQDTTPGGGVKFEQNIYAPTQLSTSDIYKQTRNQITLAKEELSIP